MRRAMLVGLTLAVIALAAASPARASEETPYTVQEGDALAHIALRHGLRLDELAWNNGIVNPALLRAGQTLWLPSDTQPVFKLDGPAVVLLHIARRGETVHRIALQYGVGADDLLRYNVLDNPNQIKAGQALAVVMFGVRAAEARAAYLPMVYDTLGEDESLVRVVVSLNLRLSAVQLYNGLWGSVVPPGARIAIPPAALLVASTGQEVAEAPTSTPRPTDTATPPPLPTQPPPTVTPYPQPTDVPTTPPVVTATPTQPPVTPAPTATPAPTGIPPGVTPVPGITVELGDPVLYNDGRSAVVFVTVWNTGVTPAIDGGRHYFKPNPDGGIQWVTLLGVEHKELPVAIVEDAPLWRANVTLTDGSTWPFYAGCKYIEKVEHTGYEPTGPDSGFVWEVNWEGGFFDCGNGYQVKPDDIPPGGVASVPLTVYFQHPRRWGSEPPPSRRIARIDLGLWRSDGVWLGDVASRVYQ
jgi:LysM repeat protein